MIKLRLFRIGIFYITSILISTGFSFAQTTFTWTGLANNNWNNAGNWTKVGASTSTYPNQNAGQNDQAIINTGTPVVNASFTNTSLTSLSINTPGTLSITGAFTLAVNGNIAGSGTFSQSNGTLNVTGDVTVSTLSLIGGTIAYTNTGPQSVKDATYNNLTKSGVGGVATLAGDIIVNGTTALTSGTLSIGTHILNSVNLSGSGGLNFGGGSVILSGNNTSTGSYTGSPFNFTYNGSSGQTLRGITYDNLTISGAGTKTVVNALTVNGTLSFGANMAMGGNTAAFQGPVTYTSGNLTSSAIVTYNSSSNQDVPPGTANALVKNGTGTATLSGNIACSAGIVLTAGTLDFASSNLSGTTLSGAGSLDGGSGTLTLTGSNTHSGTFNSGTSTVVYAVNAAQTVQGYGATGYYNLNISNNNTKTVANALTVNNILTYSGSGTLAIGNSNADFNHFNQTAGTITLGTGTLSFSGNFHKTGGTYTAGSGALTLSGTGFIRSNSALSLSSGATSVSGTRTIQGASAITLNNVSVAGTLSNKVTLVVNTALSGAGTFSNDSTASQLDVNFTGAGPTVASFNVSGNGTVRYSAAGAQTTTATTYNNLSTSGSGTKTISAGSSVLNDLALGAPADCSFGITIPGNVSGTSSFNLTGNSTLTVTGNYTATGGLTIAGTGTFNANGTVSHGSGALSLNSSTINISGTLTGTGTVTFSGTGALNFTGSGGWNSTTGTFTPSTTTVTYSAASGSQTVRSTTYNNLTLSGASTKNYGTGATGAVSGVFNNMAGETLIFPVTAATLTLTGSVTGTGEILGDPAGTLTISSSGAVSTSLGTLYFDTTKAIGTINFNRQWNRAFQVRIGSSVRLKNYTFLGGFVVGGVEIADGEIFKVESAVVTPTSTLATNVGRLRYILLGTGSKFVFQPTGIIPAGTNLTFPVGPLPTAGTQWQVLEGNAEGTLNAAIIGATTINGSGANFNDQVLVGYNLELSNGTIVGEIESMPSNTQLILKAPGAQVVVPAGSTFRLSQVYRPVTIIPSVAVSGGSLEVSLLNHTGGMITSGTNVPNVPINRRTNFIYKVRATGGFPTSAIWTESLLSNDFNATINPIKYSFFRWNGAFWTKLAADFVGAGAVPTNTQIQRNTITTMPGVQTFVLGQTGGVLPDDPTFSWTGAGGNNQWKNSGNWNVFPSGAGPWPDDIGHNVVIDGSGINGPTIGSADSINVRHIFHSAKTLTVQNNGVLNIVGNYSFNQPTLTAAGVGRLIQTGFNLAGTNNSQFSTQLSPGSLLYSTDGGFIGSVRSVTNNSALVLQGVGGGTVTNIPDSTTFNFISPGIAAGAGNLTAVTTSNVVTGTGFTSALNGRALYVGANLLVGTVAYVQSATSLLLVNNSYQNATALAYSVSSAVVPFGSATTNFQDGSKVNYNSPSSDQTIAATSYSNINMMDNRVGANTDIVRYVNCPGRTLTIRGRFRGRVHVKPAASLGPIWQFNNNSRMSVIFPTGSSIANGGSWNNFSTNGVAGSYNVKWGTASTSRIHYDGYFQGTTAFTIPPIDREIGSRFGDFSLICTNANGRWVIPPGAAFTVNGAFSLNNTAGAGNDVLNFGNSTVNPAVSLKLLGSISGLNNLVNAGAPVHLGDLTIAGTGTISGDLFESVSQLRNLTVNRVGANVSLSAAQTLTVSEKITISNGTFGHTGSGTITAGSAAVSGIDVTGGSLAMSGSSNLALATNGGLTISGGATALNNTGSVTVAGNYTQTAGTFRRTTNPSTLQGNISVTAGTFNVTGSTISFTGTAAQTLSFPTAGVSFNNLTINKSGGSATVTAGKLKMIGSINMLVTNVANLVTTPSGNLTLVSNSTGTGRIGSVLGGVLSGSNFTSERYVNGGVQGWYFLGTPVNGQTLTDWSDDFAITTPVTCTGTLTDIIDRNTVYHLEGDAVPSNGPSPSEANGWRAPTSCAIDIVNGYRVFLKSTFFGTARVIDNTGAMTSGPKSMPVTFNAAGYDGGGWNLVSNPYPSNIDWDAIGGWTKTNMQNAIYIWKGSTNQYGSYVGGISVNGVDNVIPSGQAFLVKANASSPILTANENAKTAVAKNLMRTAVDQSILRLTLQKGTLADETAIHFGLETTDAFDGQSDAVKIMSPGLNLFTLTSDKNYSINGLAPVETHKTIPLGVTTSEMGTFVINVKGISSMSPGMEVMLRDNYLSQLIEVTEDLNFTFEVNDVQVSQGSDRFELIFINSNTVTAKGNLLSSRISLYPNPAQNGSVRLTLDASDSQGNIEVIDMLGKVVHKQKASEKSNTNLLSVPEKSGIYTVSFKGEKGTRWSSKLVVQ